LHDPKARVALRRRLGSDQPPDPELVARAERVDPEQAAQVEEQVCRHLAGEPNDFRPLTYRILGVGLTAIRCLGDSEIIIGRARAVTPRSPPRSRTT
jgi:hypothetical protein